MHSMLTSVTDHQWCIVRYTDVAITTNIKAVPTRPPEACSGATIITTCFLQAAHFVYRFTDCQKY